ncbi:MAG: tetratricopeptide repeat protein [Desulfurivibrionaceae bacterium]|jgi:tetratricopeptide (TPR) repeat protein
MDTIKRVLVSAVLVLLIAIWGGCAAAPAATPEPEMYYPKLPPGITTIEEAKQDLAILLKEVDVIYYGRSSFKLPGDGVLRELYGKYSRMSINNILYTDDRYNIYKDKGGAIDVFDDRIDFPLFPLYYKDLSEDVTILVRWGYMVELSHHVQLRAPEGTAQKIADDLYFIQKHMERYNGGELEVFKEKAAKYRASKIKPQVSEAQRKFIVQANAFTQKKDYAGAIDRYNKAIELDPVSYPEAYFNLALLSAQEDRFKSAIGYMEKYLLLAPDAKDARSAQDKIYEWEAMVAN